MEWASSILAHVFLKWEPSYHNQAGINSETGSWHTRPEEGGENDPSTHTEKARQVKSSHQVSFCQFTRTHLVGGPLTHHVKMGRVVSSEVGCFTHFLRTHIRTQHGVTWFALRLSVLNLIQRFFNQI